MTKKHFIQIAKAISETNFASEAEKQSFVRRLIPILASVNPAFRATTFQEACQ